jgi:hypothetical protein
MEILLMLAGLSNRLYLGMGSGVIEMYNLIPALADDLILHYHQRTEWTAVPQSQPLLSLFQSQFHVLFVLIHGQVTPSERFLNRW